MQLVIVVGHGAVFNSNVVASSVSICLSQRVGRQPSWSGFCTWITTCTGRRCRRETVLQGRQQRSIEKKTIAMSVLLDLFINW